MHVRRTLRRFHAACVVRCVRRCVPALTKVNTGPTELAAGGAQRTRPIVNQALGLIDISHDSRDNRTQRSEPAFCNEICSAERFSLAHLKLTGQNLDVTLSAIVSKNRSTSCIC